MQEISNYSLVAAAIAAENQFDVIHAHDWLCYPAGIAAKYVSGKPLVIHVHATDFDRSGGNVNPVVYDIEKRGMDAADRIITVSNLTRNIVIEKYDIAPEKVVTVYNAVEPIDYEELAKAPDRGSFDEKIVTFLGRITMQKGPEYFIEAANLVLKKMNNVRFVMAGSGDMMNKMIRQAARLGICDKFSFTGFLKGDDVYRMFRLSDVYVMPSVSEPFGISPLEAMQSNVPVIISRQSGVAEILKHAVKVDFWDTHAMADAIYGILNYPALHNIFSKHGKNEVDKLTWETSAKHVRDVYFSVI
jgi:glycosyltransferase involved in cell wall biosynthesis